MSFADGDLPDLPIVVQRHLEAAELAVDALPRQERCGLDLRGFSSHG
ncbi:MAG: hypothetical protein ACK516_02470 [Cyanobium sp.]